MPLYEYLCPDHHVFEVVCTVDQRHDSHGCPRCGGVGRKVILHAPKVFSDYGGYESPATGKWIEGRRARMEDLARSGCRPYEEGEREHAAKIAKEEDRKLDQAVDAVVEQTLADITL